MDSNFFFFSQGYPRLLSGDMLVPKTLANMHETTLFPGSATAHVYNANTFRRHRLSFPQYPFRTLCPRDAQRLLGRHEFDQTSPMFPAHTQINFKFKRRAVATLLNYMLPTNLNLDLGASNAELNVGQRETALNFTVMRPPVGNAAAVNDQYAINGVEVVIQDMYLQVSTRRHLLCDVALLICFCCCFQVVRLRYKGISPERPLSNIYTCLRTRFTPLQKVSLHTYDLAWETTARPYAVYIGFVK